MGTKEESSAVVTRVGYSGQLRPTQCEGGKCTECGESVWVTVRPVLVHTNIIQYIHLGCKSIEPKVVVLSQVIPVPTYK